MRLRDAALVAAQKEVISAQDRYDSPRRDLRHPQAGHPGAGREYPPSGMFILPRNDGRCRGPERYNLWKAPGRPEHAEHPGREERARPPLPSVGEGLLTLWRRPTAGWWSTDSRSGVYALE